MDPYLGEIKLWALTYAPTGWHLCDGSLLQISTNQALYALLGTHYGGNGTTTFGLPDLRGRVPVSAGALQIGTQGGEEAVTLTANQVPQHTHQVGVHNDSGDKAAGSGNHIAKAVSSASGAELNLFAAGNSPKTAIIQNTVSATGGGQGHSNMQPYLALNYYIATTGIFPPRN